MAVEHNTDLPHPAKPTSSVWLTPDKGFQLVISQAEVWHAKKKAFQN
jgi:hypothetical protein